MVTINTIELADESVFPDEQVLRSVLGKSYDAYCSKKVMHFKVKAK